MSETPPIQDVKLIETPVPSSFSAQIQEATFSHWEIIASGQYIHPVTLETVYWAHLVKRATGEGSLSRPHR